MKIILDMTQTLVVCYSHGERNRPDAERRESKMQLHPSAVRMVAELIAEGRAGRSPYGIGLELWVNEIERIRKLSQMELELLDGEK
jgi:hypothetical protein